MTDRDLFDKLIENLDRKEVADKLYSTLVDDYYDSYEGSELEEYPLDEYLRDMLG